MNKFLAFVFFFCISISNAQEPQIEFFFGKTDYIPATVQLSNGKILAGEVQDFDSPNSVEVKMYDFVPNSIERNANFFRKKIKFRKNSSEKHIEIPSDSINYITHFDKETNEVKEFKRLKILKTKNNGEIEETNNVLFLPLIKKDSINYYGYNVVTSSGDYLRAVFYLNNSKDNLAINPLDLDMMDLFKNQDRINNDVINAIKAVTKDCPEFQNQLNEKVKISEEMKTTGLAEYKRIRKEINDEKKKLKTKKEKREYENKAYQAYYVKSFYEVTKDYKNTCK